MSTLRLQNSQSDGADWIHIVPRGEFAHAASGLVEVYDQDAIERILANFRARSAAANFPGIYLGEEHFYYDASRSTEAYGWIKGLRAGDDGIWGRVEWTDLGRQAVENRRFKFVSPVHLRADVECLDNQRVRPLAVDTVGLTNNPNLRGMVPLRNRGAHDRDTQHHTNDTLMLTILEALGLAPDANETAAVQAVTQLRNRAENPDVTQYTQQIDSLTTERDGLRQRLATAELRPFANRIAGQEPFWEASYTRDPEGTLKALHALPAPTATQQPANLLNRANARTPDGASNEQHAGQSGQAAQIANRAYEIASQQRIPYSKAFRKAQSERS